jgi:hypothetical protein
LLGGVLVDLRKLLILLDIYELLSLVIELPLNLPDWTELLRPPGIESVYSPISDGFVYLKYSIIESATL